MGLQKLCGTQLPRAASLFRGTGLSDPVAVPPPPAGVMNEYYVRIARVTSAFGQDQQVDGVSSSVSARTEAIPELKHTARQGNCLPVTLIGRP